MNRKILKLLIAVAGVSLVAVAVKWIPRGNIDEPLWSWEVGKVLKWIARGDIDEPLWPWEAGKELSDAIGFTPEEATLLYSWRNCCKFSEPFGGESPGSVCAVYELGRADFERVQSRQYPKFQWTMSQLQCWGHTGPKGPMKGCSGFVPTSRFENLKLDLHGEKCWSDTGTILKIDVSNRLVVVERYFWE